MEIYTVKVAVKPYTKAYLENNYGNPADIRQDPELNDMVTMMLREGPRAWIKSFHPTFRLPWS